MWWQIFGHKYTQVINLQCLLPGGGSWYWPSGVHQHTPTVPSVRVALDGLVEASLSAVWDKHSVVLVLPRLFLGRLLLLITRRSWGERSEVTREPAGASVCRSAKHGVPVKTEVTLVILVAATWQNTSKARLKFITRRTRERKEFLSTVEHKVTEKRKLDVQIAILAPCGAVYGH